MPIDDVARLLSRWQRARTPTEQVRVVTAAARTLRSLSAEDRRLLAAALVEGGAGDAAVRIEDAAGATSNADLTALARSLRTVEPHRLEAIAATLNDPAERRRLTASAAAGIGQGRSDRTEAVTVTPTAPPAPDAQTAAPTGPAVALPPPATSGTEPPPPPTLEPPAPEPPAPEPPAPEPPAPEPPAPEPPADDDGSDVTSDVDPTLAALAAAATPRDRLRALAHLEDATIGPDDLVAVLRALPDGWQRRAAARRLLGDAPRVDIDAEQVVTSFARASDRTAVAAILIDQGHAHVETVVDHLDPRAADRLRRRTVSGG